MKKKTVLQSDPHPLETLQELSMLSSITPNCYETKTVMNSRYRLNSVSLYGICFSPMKFVGGFMTINVIRFL